MPDSFFSICIGRQYGSGGRMVGRKVAERLGATYYDSEILDLAARESGLCREVFERSDERKGFFGAAFRAMSSFVGMGTAYPGQDRDVQLFEIQAEAIRKAADEANCVFIGRAADYILRDRPFRLSIFVTADEPDRIRWVCSHDHVGDREALRLMERIDERRAAFYSLYSGKTWGAAASYDLCINTSKVGIDGAAEIIAESIKSIQP